MKEKIKVLFVCHGNICRSPMAEYVLKHMVSQRGLSDRFDIASAATSTEELGNDIHHGTKGILHKYNIPFSRRGARQITARDYTEYDYLIGMDTANIRNMHRAWNNDPEGKVYKLLQFADSGRDVADPWYTGDFEVTYEDVVDGCEGFLRYLEEQGQL